MLVASRGIIPLVFLALWVYCVLDAIATDSAMVQNLPKIAWVFIVILFPPIGPIAWLLLGRPSGAGFSIGGRKPRRSFLRGRYRYGSSEGLPPLQQSSEERPPRESREEALRRYYEEKRRREEDLRRREDELRRGDESGGASGQGPDLPEGP